MRANAGDDEVQPYVYAAVIKGCIPRGPIQVSPAWHADYQARVFERILHAEMRTSEHEQPTENQRGSS
jgi:hypothetical protein